MFKCPICANVFSKMFILNRHVSEQHDGTKYVCAVCNATFARRYKLIQHSRSHQSSPVSPPAGPSRLPDSPQPPDDFQEEELSVLDDVIVSSRYTPKIIQTDSQVLMTSITSALIKYLGNHLSAKRGIKWNIFIRARYTRELNDGEEVEALPYFRGRTQTSLLPDVIPGQIDSCIGQISEAMGEFQDMGSGWTIDRILFFQVDIITYMPLVGGTYIELPPELSNSGKGLLNIRTNDQKCFLWCILAKLHPQPPHFRIDQRKYEPYVNELDCSDISFPFELDTFKLKIFELKNNLSINIFAYEKEVFPLHVSDNKVTVGRQIDLLYLVSGENKHFCLIKDLSRLLSHFTHYNGKTYVCRYCLHRFAGKNAENNHREHVINCNVHGPQLVKMPRKKPILRFEKVDWKQKVPYVIYADFESIINKVQTCLPDSSLSSTTKLSEHVACGFSYVVVGPDGKPNTPVTYRGTDAIDIFLESLLMERENITQLVKENVPMDLTPAEEQLYRDATHCYVCEGALTAKDPGVRDHCHFSGCFRGVAHNSCNLKLRIGKFTPVILHNLSRYDAHLIMQRIGLIKEEIISCIPSNTETYISFSFGRLRFIDSFRFMPASLDTLISNLAMGGPDKFPILNAFYPSHQIPFLLKKLTYPYDYMSGVDKFEEDRLPSKEAFYNALTDEHLSDEGYKSVCEVWDVFNIKNLGELHDLYVQADSLQLADVFESFRAMCVEFYGLDCAHAYTGPGFAWESALCMTKVQLQLLLDIDMHLFLERGIRGGVAMISHRFARANNPYIPETYDATKPSNYIMYLDMNNLYGHAMVDSLPTANFALVPVNDILDYANKHFLPLSVASPYGFILEVDLEYPEELHSDHNCYPLAPESRTITTDLFSSYYKLMLKKLNLPAKDTLPKLVPNLFNKERYVVHYRNLKYYVSKGMKLTHVHKILSFSQSPWLRPFIEFNTEKRKLAKNNFEREFFKLLNNSTFGKTMENLRNRIDFHLVQTPERAIKKASSPAFEKFTIFHNDLVGIQMKKKSLTLNRPIYTGFSVLELSKLAMYEFHYDYMRQTFGDRARLLFTDTDSLTYDIQTPDVYVDFQNSSHLFDFSGYPPNHPLHDDSNKKVIGKMKDEMDGVPIKEFVGLRPKMYSILSEKGEKKTAKGVCRRVVEKTIRHSNYRECLLQNRLTRNSMKRIVSQRHELFTVSQNKMSLNPCDNKRYIVGDGIRTLAYGHKWIKILNPK